MRYPLSSISFTDYIKKNYDSKLWEAMENYLKDADSACFSFRLNKIRDIENNGDGVIINI